MDMSRQRKKHPMIVSVEQNYKHNRKIVSSTPWHLLPRQRQIINCILGGRHAFKRIYWLYARNYVAYKYRKITKKLW